MARCGDSPVSPRASSSLWRAPLPALARAAGRGLRRLREGAAARVGSLAGRLSAGIRRHRAPDGLLLRSWPTGGMALWVMTMLLAWLVLYYLA